MPTSPAKFTGFSAETLRFLVELARNNRREWFNERKTFHKETVEEELRLLVLWTAARSKNWPDAPTLRETGIDIISNSPFGIAGPKGMDPAVVRIIHDAFKKGAEDPAYLEATAKLDQEPAYLNTEDYRRYAVRELAEQKKLIEDLGLRQE